METILLIDDEESIIDICEELLESLGYNVLKANNGNDALQTFTENKDIIDLVILDMIMPGLSGAQTFDGLKLLNPKVKVMLSSGYVTCEQVKKIMEKGCDAFLHKPFRLEEFSQKIREVLDSNA